MKALLVGATSSAPTAGSTQYQPFITHGATSSWSGSITAPYEQVLPHAITLDRLRVSVDTAPGTGKNFVFTVLKNGVATSLTCTISGTNTNAQDLTHSVSFVAGDTITLQGALDTGGAVPGFMWWTGRQDASSQFALLGSANTTSTGWYALNGCSPGSMTSGDSGLICPCGGTVSNLYVISSAASANVTVYKNGVAQTLTTGSMGSTTAHDTTHSFTVSAGDRISIRNTGTGRLLGWGVTFAPTTDTQSFFGHIDNNHNAPTGATSYYQPMGDGDQTFDSTESNTYLKVQACTIIGYYGQSSVSPGVSPKAYAMTVRQNAADTSATITINDASSSPTDGSSGRAANITSLSISVSDDDNIDIKIVPSSTPTGLHLYSSVLITMSSGGTQYTQSLTASLSMSGTLTKQTNKSLSGNLSMSGAITRAIIHNLSANLTLAGNLTKALARAAMTATLTVSGSLKKQLQRTLTGTLTFSGAITLKSIVHNMAANLTLSGSLIRTISHKLSGNLTASGNLLKTTFRTLTGTLTTSGSVTSSHVKLTTLTANLTMAGNLGRTISKQVTGSLQISGSLKKAIVKGITGTLIAVGNLTKQTSHNLTANLTMQGSLTKLVKKTLTAGLTLSGSLAKLKGIMLTAGLALSGVVSKLPIKTLTANLTTSGNLTKQTNKLLSGNLIMTGSLKRIFTRLLTATLNLSGTLSHIFSGLSTDIIETLVWLQSTTVNVSLSSMQIVIMTQAKTITLSLVPISITVLLNETEDEV